MIQLEFSLDPNLKKKIKLLTKKIPALYTDL